jgi:hypothetical protein
MCPFQHNRNGKPSDMERNTHTHHLLSEGEEPMTAGGGNLIGSEVNRNKRSAQWAAASIEIADMEQPPALVCSLPAH